MGAVVMPAPLLMAAACLLALLAPVPAERIPSGFGPFRIEFRSITSCDTQEKCGNPQKMVIKNLKVGRDANNQWKYLYNMDVNLSVPIDDNFKSEVRVSRWNTMSSSWTGNVFRMTVGKPCSSFKQSRPDIFKQMSDQLYDGKMTECPIPALSAIVRDFAIESKPPSHMKSLPYGRFKSRMKFIDNSQECLSCYDVVIDVLPKRRS